MTTHARNILAMLLAAGLVPALARAQEPQKPPAPATGSQADAPISVAEVRKALGKPEVITATVSSIDYDKRIVVLRDDKGMDRALYVGEDVKRLKNVKQGDKLTVTYYMSLMTNVLQPGDAGAPGTKSGVVGTTGAGDRPGGTAALQERWVVTVDAVDTAAQTVRVTGEQGRSFTFKAEDPKKLAQVKPGDRIAVVFTAAAIVSVAPAK